MDTGVDFFLGANTPRGFVSRFGELGGPREGWRLWVIKGAPGSGKSTLMHTVRAAMQPFCREIHNIRCSSDCRSLDALVFPEHRLAIADGTPPHAIEPAYIGAYENIVSLCDCWDKAALYARREDIFALSDDCAALHRRCSQELAAAWRIIAEGRRLFSPSPDIAKLDSCAARIAAAEFGAPAARRGCETVRLLSAVTDKGHLLFSETAQALAGRIYALRDDWGAAAPMLLLRLRERALACGLDIITCVCPLSPENRMDHLFIPSLSLGFMTVGAFHPAQIQPCRAIRAERFIDGELPRRNKHKLAFLRRSALTLIGGAADSAAKAKATHDRLEAVYSPAMDFCRVAAVAEDTAREFLRAAGVE